MRIFRFNKGTLVKVLVFVFVSFLFTLAVAIKIGNYRLFSHTYSLSAVFDDANGVFKGDAVKLAGVDIGRVTGTEIREGKAVVTFNVDEDQKLTSDSIIAIRWRNVIGLRFLYVYPGDGGGTALQDGDEIPLSQTESAGDVGEFLNRLGPILKAIDPHKANEFLNAVNTALSGSEVAVRQLLTDGATLAGRLGEKDQVIGELVSNSSKILAAYASQSGNIGRILDDLDTVGGKLAGVTDQVNQLITNFADVQQQLDRVLVQNRSNIDGTISNLNSVAQTLDLNKTNLEHTLCSLPAGVAPYYQTTTWGQWFNVRVTQILFKDTNGQVISTAGDEGNRGATSGKVYACGPWTPKNARDPRPSFAGTSGLGSFLDFVVARGEA
jgi:phospholipid/cholesterol/gamma-HCH transport system substrate-binding protein